MKTLEEVKDDYAGEQGRDSWEDYFNWLDLCHTPHHIMQQHYNEVARRYATEYGKEVQKNIHIMLDKTMLSILSKDNLPSHE